MVEEGAHSNANAICNCNTMLGGGHPFSYPPPRPLRHAPAYSEEDRRSHCRAHCIEVKRACLLSRCVCLRRAGCTRPKHAVMRVLVARSSVRLAAPQHCLDSLQHHPACMVCLNIGALGRLSLPSSSKVVVIFRARAPWRTSRKGHAYGCGLDCQTQKAKP